MKLLKACVLVLALLLVACEGAVSPTEPQLIQSEETRALPDGAGPESENQQDPGRPEKDEPE